MKNNNLWLPFTLLAMSMPVTGIAFDDTTSIGYSPEELSFSQTEYHLPGSGLNIDFSNTLFGDKWLGQSRHYQISSLKPGEDDTSQLSIDIKRRLYSYTENTYVAMGLGWDDIGLSDNRSTSGMRFVAEGRLGLLGPTYVFGQAALAPWLSDTEKYVNPFGKELELGFAVEPLPSMSFRAGYRSYWLDLSDSNDASTYQNQTDGFFIGGGLHW